MSPHPRSRATAESCDALSTVHFSQALTSAYPLDAVVEKPAVRYCPDASMPAPTAQNTRLHWHLICSNHVTFIA
jgi:hypothetical protein